MQRAAVVPLRDLFRSEIREAKSLGLRLDVRTDPGALGSGTAYARLSPTTPKATHALKAAAAQDGSPGRNAVEVRQSYTDPSDTADAIGTAVRRALEIATQALA